MSVLVLYYLLAAMIWMFVSPPNLKFKILKPDAVILGAFRRYLGHKDGALMSEISALVKQTPTESPNPFHYVRTQ